MPSTSFFTGLTEAERYAKSRPPFHPLAIARARETLGLEETVPLALDVACGTGQSAAALLSIAARVIGFDISRNMLRQAAGTPRLQLAQARAEAMPFPSGSVPLMTTALAFHWFDRDRFLGEAWRVLQPGGWLFIYNNGFRGSMRENPAFQDWARADYPQRYPTPPRDSRPLTPAAAAWAGFAFVEESSFDNEVSFTPAALVAYLTTQTNVAAAVAEGRESLEAASAWLLAQVRPFFTGPAGTFLFSTRAWSLKKASPP